MVIKFLGKIQKISNLEVYFIYLNEKIKPSKIILIPLRESMFLKKF